MKTNVVKKIMLKKLRLLTRMLELKCFYQEFSVVITIRAFVNLETIASTSIVKRFVLWNKNVKIITVRDAIQSRVFTKKIADLDKNVYFLMNIPPGRPVEKSASGIVSQIPSNSWKRIWRLRGGRWYRWWRSWCLYRRRFRRRIFRWLSGGRLSISYNLSDQLVLYFITWIYVSTCH